MSSSFVFKVKEIVMRIYVVAVAIALGSVGMIINACMFRDTETRHAPVNIAHLR